jgi:predicted outer membrane repeat protein
VLEPIGAEVTLGDGTQASCTEATLRSALVAGGTIRLSCGGPVTIRFASLVEIAADTVLDGAGQLTLDGGGQTRLFYVNKWEKRNGTVLELRNLTLTGGRSGGTLDPTYGGCIYARRSVTRLVNVTMRGCQATAAGGALYVYGGSASITGGTIAENGAVNGGAIYVSQAGTLAVRDAAFQSNTVSGDGGALYTDNSAVEIQNSSFTGNRAEGTTGKPFAGLGGAIYTNNPGAKLTVGDSRFTGNLASESGGAIFADYDTTTTIAGSFFTDNKAQPQRSGAYGSGGAIGQVRGVLTLSNSELRNNQAFSGGGLYNGKESRASLSRVLISENRVALSGGGIYSIWATLSIADSSIVANLAGSDGGSGSQGGGIVSYKGTGGSTIQLLNSTVSHNRVLGSGGSGGGVYISGTELTISSSTLAANSATHHGGGLLNNSGNTRITGSTFADNSSPRGGSIGTNNGTVSVKNSLIVNGGERQCSKPLTDLGNNFQFPGTSCGSGIREANPRLRGLGNYGGPTHTMALEADSPAINAGDGESCTARDQRGFVRIGGCDSGAFEFGADGPPALTIRTFLPLVRR